MFIEQVFLVTGGSGGLGKELATILYQRNAKIYIAARSTTKALTTIDEIKRRHPNSSGELMHLHLDLDDLTTIKKSADEFLAKETRLDVLWNNAGVMVPPQGSKTAQGYELQLGTNNLAPFLFTHHLLPLLKETAKKAPKNSVRVVWVSSSAATFAPTPPIDFSNMDYKKEEGPWTKYGRSKAGNVLHAVELARRTSGDGIVSLVWPL
jgi:NAD(P)-dependent dehydrogenase (short-subunit alcohol dehydrogenase family)